MARILSHATDVNESWFTYEWPCGTMHLPRHIVLAFESRYACEGATTHIWRSHGTNMNGHVEQCICLMNQFALAPGSWHTRTRVCLRVCVCMCMCVHVCVCMRDGHDTHVNGS